MSLLALLGLALLLLNLYATVLVARNLFYDTPQKIAQLCIVWFVPVLGGLLVAHFARERQPPRRRARGNAEGDAGDYGDISLPDFSSHDAGFGDSGGDAGGGGGD